MIEDQEKGLGAVRSAAGAHINLSYPPHRQANIERLAPKFDAEGQPDGNYTEGERTAMWAFIDAVRARSNVLEAEMLAAENPRTVTVDYSDITP